MSRRSRKAQAMVEFALALPIFLLVVIGLLEAGRLIFIYASVVNAGREAARYGSAWGVNDAGAPKYQDCPGIRDTAKKVGFLLGLQDSNITIQYDHGPGVTGTAIPNCTSTSGPQTNVIVQTGDRIIVTVQYVYNPIVNFIPLSSRTISSSPAARTIMGRLDLNKP